MKNRVFFVIVLVLMFASLMSMNSEVFEMETNRRDLIEVKFNLDSYNIEKIKKESNLFKKLTHPEASYMNVDGKPELPTFSTTIAIPKTGGISLKTENLEAETISNFKYYPYQNDQLDGFNIEKEFYNGNRSQVSKMVEISEPAILRGLRIVNLTVRPVEFNPKENEIKINKNIKIELTPTDKNSKNEIMTDRKVSRSFEKIYKSKVLNYEEIRDVEEYQPRSILVISPNNESMFYIYEYFIEWKKQKGFNVNWATTSETGTNSSSIKNYIQDAYENWNIPPEYVILMGDTDEIPAYAEGDHYYTTVDGSDILGDIFIGRLSYSNETELATMVNKVMFYEKEPYLGETDWYEHSLLVGDNTPSGASTIFTNKYIKEVLKFHNPEHSFTELYSGNPSVGQMNQAMNDGTLYFNYRYEWMGP